MRKLLTICYDGTNYCGWQVQPNGITVQQVILEKLSAIMSDCKGVTGCSRTDSGVHANMYCLHFDTESNIPNKNIVNALNSMLPFDISALSCEDVDEDFHARYSCTAKEYVYKIYNGEIRNPFKEKYYLHIKEYIDCDVLNKSCQMFLGEHDFSAFCASGSSVKTTVRNIYDCSIERFGEDVIFRITGDGFLYNMVRIIVGTLLDINNGKIEWDDIPKIIESKDRKNAGKTAKPTGLYLNKVYYGEVK